MITTRLPLRTQRCSGCTADQAARGAAAAASALLVLALVAAGCADRRPAAATATSAPSAPAPAPRARSPRSARELPTTDAEIAIGNLESQLAGLARTAELQPSARSLAALATMYLAHGKMLGRLAEYDRAQALADRAMSLDGKEPAALMARAAVRATFHQFADALADLARAEALGARPWDVEGQRAALLQAQGKLAEARVLRERRAASRPTIDTLGELATLDAAEERVAEADRGFEAAIDRYRDVSPFPVAWLWLAQGLMWQKQGQPARARELLAAVVERLPQYAPAVGHLAAVQAELGEREPALALLRPLVDRSDDPEYGGQLAALLAATGQADEAKAVRERAAARFEQLLATHPAAYGDHAARFFLGAGGDPARALKLAEADLAARRTVEAARLLMDAASAAGNLSRACDGAELAVELAPSSLATHFAAWRALSACGKKERAAAVLARAGQLPPPPAR